MIYIVILTGEKKLDDVDLWSIVPILHAGDGFDIFDHNTGLVAQALFDGCNFMVMTPGNNIKVVTRPAVDTPEKAYDRAMGVVR